MADFRGMVDALARSRRGVATTAALGGLALIAGLAYRATAGKTGGETPANFADLSDEEAETVLRAMIAATVADGIVDARERRHLDEAIAAAHLGPNERRWLDERLADPPRIDEIAERVNAPDLAARVYAAARLAIAADTLQERQFLKDLAESLDVPSETLARLESEVAA